MQESNQTEYQRIKSITQQLCETEAFADVLRDPDLQTLRQVSFAFKLLLLSRLSSDEYAQLDEQLCRMIESFAD